MYNFAIGISKYLHTVFQNNLMCRLNEHVINLLTFLFTFNRLSDAEKQIFHIYHWDCVIVEYGRLNFAHKTKKRNQ